MNKTNLKWKLYESININKRMFITFHIFPCFSSRILTDTSQVPTCQLDYVVHFLSKAFPLIRPFISAFKISSHWLHTSDFALFFCCSRSMWQHWQVHFTDLIKLLVSSIVDGSKLFFFLFLYMIYNHFLRHHWFLTQVNFRNTLVGIEAPLYTCLSVTDE